MHRRLKKPLVPVTCFLLCIVGVLGGCGSSTGATVSSPSPTVTRPFSLTATPNTAPFEITFQEQDTTFNCPANQSQAFACLIFQGTGRATEIGTTTMTRSAIVASNVDNNNCHAIISTGYLATGKQDHITFTATGKYCGVTDTATYTYTITGGSGKFKGASGNGMIRVGPTTSTSGNTENRVETWSGTLNYSGHS